MDEKISLEAVGVYGDAVADKISKDFFSSRNRISGPEILSLTNVPQVNMFIIRELLLTWREEALRLKSPFFDYDHPEVKESMQQLMTSLSNHISVGQEYFLPLLKKAVRQTLLVIFDPYDFFSILIAGKDNKLQLGPFREEIKYLKINKAPLARLVQKLEEKNIGELSGNEAFAILDQILEEVNFTPEDLDGHIRAFSEIIPLDPARFYAARPVPTPQAPAVSPRPAISDKPQVREVKESAPAQKPILNERMAGTQRPGLHNNLQKIAKIKDNLTINQKFMFTKVLFYGDFESFSRAIDELDRSSDMDAALQFLEKQSSEWDKESKEFHEFMEILEKRFA